MLLRTWRFFAIMCTALSMGTALCRLLETPAKVVMDGPSWLRLQQTRYHPFGTFGLYFEIAAVFTTIVLAIFTRRRVATYGWVLIAMLCLIATDAALWIWIDPIDKSLATWTPATMPSDWEELRDQWEVTNAARAALQIIALASLVISVLAETPVVKSGRQLHSDRNV